MRGALQGLFADMDYQIDQFDAELVAALRGRLTFNDHAAFGRLIETMAATGKARQVLDLNRLEFVDSAGLGMFLIARDELRDRGATLCLRAPRGEVRRVLSMARLAQIITIEE
jgi:HptB-dependent secretion and biofilm anti anti-sigma factor